MDRFNWLEIDGAEGKQEEPIYSGCFVSDSTISDKFLQEANKLFITGKFSAALRAYSRVIDDDKDCFAGWSGVVHCQLALGDLRQAQVWCDKIQEVFPEDPRSVILLAFVLAHSESDQDKQKALDKLKRCRSRSDYSTEMLLERLYCLMSGGRMKEAQDDLENFQKVINEDPDWLQRLGMLLMEFKKFAPAQAFLQVAADKCPDRAWLQYLLGRSAYGAGDKVKGKNCMRRALELDSTLTESLTFEFEQNRRERFGNQQYCEGPSLEETANFCWGVGFVLDIIGVLLPDWR